jgi:hypothetical protein
MSTLKDKTTKIMQCEDQRGWGRNQPEPQGNMEHQHMFNSKRREKSRIKNSQKFPNFH